MRTVRPTLADQSALRWGQAQRGREPNGGGPEPCATIAQWATPKLELETALESCQKA